MTRQQFETLVWERIDGTITERRRARLEAYLAQNPEAREWQREIEALARQLSAVEEVPPPVILRQRVDAALRAATPPARRRESLLTWLLGLIVPNFSGRDAVLKAERSSMRSLDLRGQGRYLAMSAKRNGIIVGFAVVVVVAILVIAYFSLNRPSAPAENASGATGAAKRYRAEQIKEQDVRLDLKGEEALNEALFSVLSDEQKADLLDRVGTGGRVDYLKLANLDEAKYANMSVKQKAESFVRLGEEGRVQAFRGMRVDERIFTGMKAEDQAALWGRLSETEMRTRLAALNVDERAFKSMSAKEQADLIGRMPTGVKDAFFQKCAWANMALERVPTNLKATAVWGAMSTEGQKAILGSLNVDERRFADADPGTRAQYLQRAADMAGRANADRPNPRGGRD